MVVNAGRGNGSETNYLIWLPQRSFERSLLLAVALEEPQLVKRDQGEGSATSNDLGADALSELGGVALETFTLLATADLDGTDANNPGVDAATDAVLLLNIDLGQVEVLLFKCKVVSDVPLGGAVHKVAHLEALDSLVLRAGLSAVHAPNEVRVTLILLVSSVVPSFRWHNLIITPQHSIHRH